MNELRYNRLLIPVLAAAVIVGAFASALLQKETHPGYSFLIIAFAFLASLLGGIGLVSIAWAVASRWPTVGGALMLVVLVAPFLAAFLASLAARLRSAVTCCCRCCF